MYVIIGADLVPTKSNLDLFINGDEESLIGKELKDVLDGASYRIFNLEVPLTDKQKPIIKQGPNLIAPTATVAGYKAMGVDLLTLANNHILDQDVQGLESTVRTLDKAGISYVGVGENVEAANKPAIFSFAGKRIGVYACAEHEFSIATEISPGANPFDQLWSLDHVAELKKSVDYVIVLYHGGKEHYRYPSPMLQKSCRRMVDKGADLVICQHSHCIGCEEKYKDATIVYGQGNFLFDHSDNEFWKTSLLVRIDENMGVSYIPFVKTGNSVRIADGTESKEIAENFLSRSDEIQKPGFVQEKYDEFSDSFLLNYLKKIKGKETVGYKVVNKILGNKLRERTVWSRYDTEHLVSLWNWIECEAHHEVLLRGIKRQIKKNIDCKDIKI